MEQYAPSFHYGERLSRNTIIDAFIMIRLKGGIDLDAPLIQDSDNVLDSGAL